MAACERCLRDGAVRYSLLVTLDGGGDQLAGFTLCSECCGYGDMIEPIVGVSSFLNPSHMVIADIEYQPVLYYVMDCKTFEYAKDGKGQAWRTDTVVTAQEKVAELNGVEVEA